MQQLSKKQFAGHVFAHFDYISRTLYTISLSSLVHPSLVQRRSGPEVMILDSIIMVFLFLLLQTCVIHYLLPFSNPIIKVLMYGFSFMLFRSIPLRQIDFVDVLMCFMTISPKRELT